MVTILLPQLLIRKLPQKADYRAVIFPQHFCPLFRAAISILPEDGFEGFIGKD